MPIHGNTRTTATEPVNEASTAIADEPSQFLHCTEEERACLKRLDKLADILDRSIRLPFGIRVGLDGLIGLVPGVGDVSTFAVSAWIINEARRLDVSTLTLWRMLWNVVVDTLLGTIPLIGDLFDFFNKANVKNIQLLKKNLAKRQAARAQRAR